MKKGIIGKKIGMTQIFDEIGNVIPVTVIQAGPCPVVQKKTVETDGYNPKHIGVLNAFASAILHGTPLVADGREGIRAVTLSNAMHLSAWTGKEIDLRNFDHELYYEELMKRVATSRRKETVTTTVAADMSSTFGS